MNRFHPSPRRLPLIHSDSAADTVAPESAGALASLLGAGSLLPPEPPSLLLPPLCFFPFPLFLPPLLFLPLPPSSPFLLLPFLLLLLLPPSPPFCRLNCP